MRLLGRKQSRPIDAVFKQCRKAKRSAFIPYLCGGDPDLPKTLDLLHALVDGGADIIELGVPFSDPIADGPRIQRAAFRALESGTTTTGLLRMVAENRQALGVPIVLFSYFNPIFARGVSRFTREAAESKIDGLLCVDLPPEEGDVELGPELREAGIDMIYLLAPTSTRERIDRVQKSSGGFVYYVSRVGVTGEQSELASGLKQELKGLRRRIKLPIAVGFGISSPEQVAEVAKLAEGVVVGSDLVRVVEENADSPQLATILRDRVAELTAPLRG